MTSCPTREQFLRYLAGHAPPAEETLIEQHVETCPTCKGELRLLRTFEASEGEERDTRAWEPATDLLRRLRELDATPAAGPTESLPTAPAAPADEHGTVPDGARPDSRPSRFIGHYEVLDEMPAGGMGVVFLVENRSMMGRREALKMIRAGVLASADEVERFDREIQALALLSHPHIIQVYDRGRHGGAPYFTMQLAENGSLSRHLARFGGDPRAAAALMEKVARAVQHAHEHHIIHRDLKPANVLLGKGDEPLVSDFGLVKFFRAGAEELTRDGQTPGTAPYMAPEQAGGRNDEVSPLTDVWALGVILYELLAGRRPFTGRSREEILHRILTTPVAPPRSVRPEIDAALEAVILKCLEKEPDRRYQSAGELAADLGRWLRGELPPPESGAPSPGQKLRRRPRKVAAIGLCIVALLALGASLFVAKVLRPEQPAAKMPDPAITLLGDSGPPEASEWLFGADGVAEKQPAAEAYSLRTTKAAALQLLAEPRWESYRLDADVRQEKARMGTAGIFFGGSRHSLDGGPCHLLCGMGIVERGLLSGQLFVSVSRVPDDNPNASMNTVLVRDYPFTGVDKPGVEAPWRHLAFEVTPSEVKLFFGDRCLRTLTGAELSKGCAVVVNKTPIPQWSSVPRGSLGLYLDKDVEASFRRVIIRPLKSEP
jgi:serine/threonine protein kinase